MPGDAKQPGWQVCGITWWFAALQIDEGSHEGVVGGVQHTVVLNQQRATAPKDGGVVALVDLGEGGRLRSSRLGVHRAVDKLRIEYPIAWLPLGVSTPIRTTMGLTATSAFSDVRKISSPTGGRFRDSAPQPSTWPRA